MFLREVHVLMVVLQEAAVLYNSAQDDVAVPAGAALFACWR